jgi:signal transduction histidine kinase/CheY-like chemotaxis protein
VNERYINVYGRDITEQKRSEREILMQNQRLQVLYDITTTINFSFEGQCREILKKGLEFLRMDIGIISRITGNTYYIQECVGFSDAVTPGQKFLLGETYCHITYNSREVIAIEHAKKSKMRLHPCYKKFKLESYIGSTLLVNGKKYGTINFSGVTNRGRPFSEGDRHFVRLISKWIGMRIEQEESAKELQKERRRAEELAQIKQRFLANMSHEVRTPLHAIIGMSNLLDGDNLSVEQKDYIHTIQSSSEHLLVLLNDILNFSKLDEGKIHFLEKVFSLDSMLEYLYKMFAPSASERGNTFAIRKDENVPRYIVGDSVRLQQILFNLIGNAIKFTKNGDVFVVVSMKKEGKQRMTLMFSVKDTGIGIAKNKQKYIFSVFSQENEEVGREYGGTGLGLAITKKLIELQGGTISLKSDVNHGSEFLFTLHFQRGEKPIFLENENMKKSLPEDISILYIEDNRVNQLLVRNLLKKWGIMGKIVSSGAEALEEIKKRKYDLLLLDLQMPDMDGYTFMKKISKPIPIIVLSAHVFDSEKQKALSFGVKQYITKPFLPEKLYQTIITVLNERNNNSGTKYELIKPDVLQQYTGYEMNVTKKMVSVLLENIPEIIEKIEVFVRQKKWKKCADEIHMLKSSFGFLGVDDSLLEHIEQDFLKKKQPHGESITLLISIKEKIISELSRFKRENKT